MAKISKDRLKALHSEIKLSRKFTDEEIQPIMEEALSRYMGKFTPLFGQDWDVVLNEVYPIVQHHLPSIFFRNPTAFLKPRHKTFIAKRRDPVSGRMEEVQLESQKSANTQSAILNYALSQNGYKQETRKVLLDALLFPFGVMWHGYKGDFGMTEENSIFIKNEQVFVQRTDPSRFIKDPAVSYSKLEDASWVGRIIDVRLNDVLEDDKLNIKKGQIKGFNGFGQSVGSHTNGNDISIPSATSSSSLFDFADEDFKKSSASKFVRLFEIFLRPTKKEKREGKKGLILLLSEEQEEPLRVNDWKIKAEGFPAKILEFNPVNDRMFGIPDIDTYSSIADQKNIISNLQIRNAQQNTKVWIGINKAEGDEEDIQKIQEGTNTIVLFDGDTPVNQRMFVASPGGAASSELYLIDQRIQKNLEDKSGVTDLKRGSLQSGEESATSVKIRAAGGGARPAYRQDVMSDFLKESMLYQNDLLRQFVPFKQAVRIVGSLDIEWSDNPSKEEIQADVDIELDAISMLPENPERELKEFQVALGMAIDSIRDPIISKKIEQEGKVIEISPLIEQILIRLKIRNPNIFRNIKPEESEGFVSVSEIRSAKANVEAALAGNTNIPSPPQPGQDHRARVEVYSTITNLIKDLPETIASKILSGLLQAQSALLQEEASKEAGAGQPTKLRSPTLERAGSI